MSDHSVRAAIVGTGFMASVHAEALRRIGVPVLGVVGSSPERGSAQTSALGLPSPYPAYRDLLADDRVDVVHVCSPNHLHHEHALGALQAGKHVVCEKPLAMTSEEAADLCDVAHSSGLVNAVCFIQRFYPQCQEARRRVRSGETGNVRFITGTYLQDWLSEETDWNWRLNPRLGGTLRAVGDIGSHWLDLAGFITGNRIESVIADLAIAIPTRLRPVGPSGAATFSAAVDGPVERTPIDTEDIAGILIRFDDGSRGVLTLSQVSPGRKNHLSLELSGSKASLRWCAEDPEKLWIGHRDQPNQILLRGAVPGTPAAGNYPAGHVQGYPDAFKAMYRAVYRAVAAGGPPPAPDYPTFHDGLEQAVIADAIAASAQDATWTTIDRAKMAPSYGKSFDTAADRSCTAMNQPAAAAPSRLRHGERGRRSSASQDGS
ncbi:Gfo/Idh/MocA family protein [Mycolicibacterium hodleri]|uniref:Gfo/Idh/MocA family oxidoreductase n=1 Tax=Mycolicibacterium hodleri TaxID=49897 RepID=A0A502DZ54_9MYCO|nr:Gfo/Idh/MocA family oxidoreductase [Mycolicibacterium hodleri]TPG29556.1 gfo/Idh/MocA family oxidoreductase [Mycolicibacterium hodleri]